MGGREKSVPTEVGTHSVFLMEAVMARPVTAKLANFAHCEQLVDDYAVLGDEILKFGVFVHDLFAKNYSGRSSFDQLRQRLGYRLVRAALSHFVRITFTAAICGVETEDTSAAITTALAFLAEHTTVRSHVKASY